MKTFTLTRRQVSKGYVYEVRDEEGTLISNRRSERDYVACTFDGAYYFGRLDLIGKGEHGRMLRHARELMASSSEEDVKRGRLLNERYNRIAYLKD